MKVKIQGIEVEGTPEEIVKFKSILETQITEYKVESPIVNWYTPDMLTKTWSVGKIDY